MKILLAHNDYGKYSGEEAVVDRLAAMWTAHGHEVVQLRNTTAGSRESLTGKIRGILCGTVLPKWSESDAGGTATRKAGCGECT